MTTLPKPRPKLRLTDKAYIAAIAVIAMGVLFFALELMRPACGQLFSIAHGATCPVGTTATFNDDIDIQGGGAQTMTIDEKSFTNDNIVTPGFLFNTTIPSGGGQRLIDIQQSGTSKLLINSDGSIQMLDGAIISTGASAGDIELAPQTNVAIAAGAIGEATGTMGLVFEDATALSAMPSNTAGLYADDDAGTSHLYTIDEACNQTQIAPHPASVTTQAPGTCQVPFFFNSTNIYSGTKTSIDWCLVIQDLQSITTNTYITETQIPANQVRNWWDDQAAKAAECIAIGRSMGQNACAEKAPPQYLIDAGVPGQRP